MKRLEKLVIEAVECAISRHGLLDIDGEDIDEDEGNRIAVDVLGALRGEATCIGTPTPEWEAASALVTELAELRDLVKNVQSEALYYKRELASLRALVRQAIAQDLLPPCPMHDAECRNAICAVTNRLRAAVKDADG